MGQHKKLRQPAVTTMLIKVQLRWAYTAALPDACRGAESQNEQC